MKIKKLAAGMRKKLAVLTIASVMFVFGAAGNASAYFEDLNLIRSIYTTTGVVEIGSDLGLNASTLNSNNVFGSSVALSSFDGALSSLVAGYWAHDMTNRDFYATGFANDTDGLTMLGRKQVSADATYNYVQTLYAGSGLATTIINPKETADSYFKVFDVNGNNIGSMGSNLKNDSYEMTLSLAGLTTMGYVDQVLYFFNYDNISADKSGIEKGIIRTFLTSDGTTVDLNGPMIATVINPNAVPIPGSIMLLGSGLLGLFSIRRKAA